ncbi:hypothetical protein CONPUDRAFT_167780 [Coniophora puteana RWD-64-598 SS2]|uniref:G domain-containing protein n=1 Tax=Coniophora puteana (strain RWD-64-598) TaxID=741705 RepID=A0A5M3MEK3_CONPW|nr:uncharacterized protein CONPUDRAFT_167780 [Coniophora puteana RWD-64-598 SS2]EIW77699.1 hypothetical protein CONPUDRAFT_167780 [Coniophora puteana RWD-64-598 SS2]
MADTEGAVTTATATTRAIPANAPAVSVQTPANDLVPTTEAIFNECSRFRILVAGKTGGGKSSLINGIFGTKLAVESKYTRGDATIENAFESDANRRFVLHDSMGYEAGEIENFDKVKRFVEQKIQGPESDRLHAIWLCISIPYHGGRVFETGDEKLLSMLNKISKIPLIVVFTMLDDITMSIRRNDRLELEPAIKKAKDQVEEMYSKQKCSRPFVCVSTRTGFEDTLKELTNVTMDQLEPHAPSQSGSKSQKRSFFRNPFHGRSEHAASDHTEVLDRTQEHGQTNNQVLLATAQRINPPMKVRASIDVGKRKYWKNLLSSAFFKGRPLKDCFRTIHEDIVVVWNFNHALETYMLGDEFINTVSHIVDDISPRENLETKNAAMNGDIQSNAKKVGAAVAAVSVVIHPAGLVVGGVTAAVVIATWLWGVYQQSNGIVRCMMASIVALVLIMETLFEIQSSVEDGVERLHPTTALKVVEEYQKSELKQEIHAEIQTFVGSGLTGALKGRDVVMEKITELIMLYHKDGDRYKRWHDGVVSQVQNQGGVKVQPSVGE